MRLSRSLLWLGGAVLVGFVLVTVLRTPEEGTGTDGPSSANADRVRTFWEAYNGATAARMSGEFRAAIEGYQKALRIDPEHQDSLFFLAASQEALGNYAAAASLLRRLTELYPEHGRGWSQLGTVLATKAPGASPDWEAAETAFLRSQALNPEHSGPFVSRGRLALERGDFEKARELFGIAAEFGAPEGLFLAGLAEYLDDDLDKAVGFFTRVLEMSAREREMTGRGAVSEGDVIGELTALDRARIGSKWFLYWASRRMGGYPENVPEEFRLAPPAPEATFELVSHAEGVTGGAYADLDRDGRLDLVLATEKGLEVAGRRLGVGPARDVVAFDVDSDGWEDLYVLGSDFTEAGRNVLLRNDAGDFIDVTERWGLSGQRSTNRAVVADFDGDGSLDLLEVGNRSTESASVRLFYQRDRRFVRSEALALDDRHEVDAAVADVDADGRPDVFVLGWKQPGRLFLNRREGFEEVSEALGLGDVGGEGTSALFFDFDTDGDPDLLVTVRAPLTLSLARVAQGCTPRLFRNESTRFVEVSSEVGLDRCFGVVRALAADVDGDGYRDLVLANGGLEVTHLEPSVVLRNREGRSFGVWAYLPSLEEPGRALGVAAGEGELYLFGVGALRRVSP